MMTESPSDEVLRQIEQMLATFDPESAEYAALSPLLHHLRHSPINIITGPQPGAVNATRDANIATNQTIFYLSPGDVDAARRQLTQLATYCGAAPDSAADARVAATVREWSLSLDDLELVRRRFLDGIAELAQRDIGVAALSPQAAALQMVRLLLPLIAAPVDGRHLPYRWAEVIAAIGSLTLVVPLIEARRAYQASDEHGRDITLRRLAHTLTQPEHQASLRVLLGYIQALADSGEARASAALRAAIARRAAATEPAARRLWLLTLIAAMAGGALGAELREAAAAALQTLLSQPPTDSATSSPAGSAHRSARGSSPLPKSVDDQGGRTGRRHTGNPPSGSLVIPVTPEQWRAAFQARDEQFGDHGLRQTPVPYWCYVRGGRYRIGGWEWHDAGAYVTLRPFWIARVPITVAQYRAFMDAGGYRNDAHWTPQGREWKKNKNCTQPWGWDEPQYTGANQPVTGVTWYEAAAFCAWLNAQLRDALPEGYALRLPTEAEWEVAAAYDAAGQRRPYPWGWEDPTPERAIYNESGLGAAAPVGCCPAGAAACGALDMAGNVWEVTTSRYAHYPAGSAQWEKDLVLIWDVPWRGGSWLSGSTSVRCGARDWSGPGDRVDGGVRLVVAPHSH